MVGLQVPVNEVAKCLLLTGFNLKESHVVRVCPCCIELNDELQPAFHAVLCHHAITLLDCCRRTEVLHMQVLSRPNIHLKASLVRSTVFFKLGVCYQCHQWTKHAFRPGRAAGPEDTEALHDRAASAQKRARHESWAAVQASQITSLTVLTQ